MHHSWSAKDHEAVCFPGWTNHLPRPVSWPIRAIQFWSRPASVEDPLASALGVIAVPAKSRGLLIPPVAIIFGSEFIKTANILRPVIGDGPLYKSN